MDREKVLREIIDGYREAIRQRYQYENIKRKYEIPDTINEDTVLLLRNFFLDHIYPDYEKRVELNNAFKSLDEFTKHPQKLMQVVFDATKLVFSYGRHLPKILHTGLKAMRSFRAAAHFEEIFVEEAIKNTIEAPYDVPKINTLLNLLPREEIEDFIKTSQSLFETLHDKALINKILEVIEYLISTMKKNEKSYSPSQVKGLELGFETLKEGSKLFNTLSNEDQQVLLTLIARIERDMLDDIS